MTATRRRPLGSPREWVLLAIGSGLVIVGVISRPRDAATIGIGTSLLLATPAVARSGDGDDQGEGR